MHIIVYISWYECFSNFFLQLLNAKMVGVSFFLNFGKFSLCLQIHFEPIYMGDNGQKVPCRFFDMPGIDENDIIKEDELNKIINGQIKLNNEVRTSLKTLI